MSFFMYVVIIWTIILPILFLCNILRFLLQNVCLVVHLIYKAQNTYKITLRTVDVVL